MQITKSNRRFDFLPPVLILALISAIVYLVFLPKFGYFKDDWYLMYAAGAKGAAAFKGVFIVDRPMRALVMIPAYSLFGNNPVLYNLSAWAFRLLSAVFFYRFLLMLWSRRKMTALLAALFYLLYPGFLSQPNGIDYQSQMVSLAVMTSSLIVLVLAYQAQNLTARAGWFILLSLLTTFYLGLVEYFIGMEIVKLACVLLLVFRDESGTWARIRKSVLWAACSLAAMAPFVYWRLFVFHSERGATDVDLQLSDVLGDPLKFALQWLGTLGNDILDSAIRAWYAPLQRLTLGFSSGDWIPAVGIALLTAAVWILFQRGQNSADEDSGDGSGWRREAFLLGFSLIVFGLLPVIIVGRSVDFKNFSRYSLAASFGTAILLSIGLGFISSARWRTALVSLFLISASLTHYANGLSHARETERMNEFWWQVSWRIPQMEVGTTLLANYPDIVIEEDYFVWGPASLIYYPESMHADYPQPGVYAVLAGEDTIAKILAREKQDFSNRRSIRTYPNYRNILIVSQPTPSSCVQVLTGSQPEYSTFEDKRLVEVGSFSEVEHILTGDAPRTPPQIPFGGEPEHGWCYFYERASLARQTNDWEGVARLGAEVLQNGFVPSDQIEWMPFLQAYGMLGDMDKLENIASRISDEKVRGQACRIFGDMQALSLEMRDWFRVEFCAPG